MKKILHLICNSHIDPVWQWDWNEGASTALSTFYAACNLLDKYDFVFCHNEVILYEYIEKYDPVLFKRIQELVKKGKWKIMGGWYCQPDCLVPSGESFIRQITLGREYFSEKFDARPTVALNFDSFGHTRGLPQILKKTGFDSYIFCRPLPWYVSIPDFKDYPHGPFLWEGFDGSRIKALRYEDPNFNYTSGLGRAKESIIKKEQVYDDLDVMPVLWGVGNHGGGASRKDLEDIIELQNEKTGKWQLIHSTLEDYFAATNPTQVEKRHIFVFSKAYSSVHAIKLAHDQLENSLYRAEKMCSIADLHSKYSFNKEVFKNAERILCQIEFHDVLAGTAVKSGIDSSVRKAHHAIEELNGEIFGAYNSLAVELKPAPQGEENVVLFNPYPYEFNNYVEIEVYPMGLPFDYKTEEYDIKLFDINNNPIEYQIIKSESNIAIQHRVRMIFKAQIPAFSLVSYHAHITIKKMDEKESREIKDDIVFKDNIKTVVISKKTGLLSSFKIGEKEYLNKDASMPMIFNDNADPWGWRIYDLTASTFNDCGWPQKELKNSLREIKLDEKHSFIPKELDALRIIEKGKLILEVQAVFARGHSLLTVNYRIYKDTPYIDINYHVLWNEIGKGLKIKYPLNGERSFLAQMAFGIEKYKADGIEYPTNRYVGVKNGDDAFIIYNKSGIHSASKKGNNLYLTLLNGASYCAHPSVNTVPLTPKDRFTDSIEQGVHDFYLRVGVNKIEECERIANEFNQEIYGTLFYPHGNKSNIESLINLSNSNIVISALKKRKNDTYLIRLYNGNYQNSETMLDICGIKKKIKFKKFEFKTFVFDGKSIIEADDSSIY